MRFDSGSKEQRALVPVIATLLAFTEEEVRRPRP